MREVPVAGISVVWTPYQDTQRDFFGPFKYSLNSSYSNLVWNAGVLPRAIIPCGSCPADRLLDDVDFLVLTGGGDPDTALFGEVNQGSRNPRSERACWDMALYKAASGKGIPVLGICLGMQLIGISHGSSLIQDIESQVENHIQHETLSQEPVSHSVEVKEDTDLRKTLSDSPMVSSCHHQVLRTVPEGFIGAAYSTDGLLEAIESKDGRTIGVQWHPERDSTGANLIKMMVRIAREK